jgi:hypothetical protein
VGPCKGKPNPRYAATRSSAAPTSGRKNFLVGWDRPGGLARSLGCRDAVTRAGARGSSCRRGSGLTTAGGPVAAAGGALVTGAAPATPAGGALVTGAAPGPGGAPAAVGTLGSCCRGTRMGRGGSIGSGATNGAGGSIGSGGRKGAGGCIGPGGTMTGDFAIPRLASESADSSSASPGRSGPIDSGTQPRVLIASPHSPWRRSGLAKSYEASTAEPSHMTRRSARQGCRPSWRDQVSPGPGPVVTPRTARACPHPARHATGSPRHRLPRGR